LPEKEHQGQHSFQSIQLHKEMKQDHSYSNRIIMISMNTKDGNRNVVILAFIVHTFSKQDNEIHPEESQPSWEIDLGIAYNLKSDWIISHDVSVENVNCFADSGSRGFALIKQISSQKHKVHLGNMSVGQTSIRTFSRRAICMHSSKAMNVSLYVTGLFSSFPR
jgi:hypothetical protein